MRFFLDENFPKAADAWLVRLGHEVFDIRGSDKEGMPDHELFREVQESGAVFLTTDRDFFHTIPHLHDHHAGVLVIALRQPKRAAIMEKLDWALTHFKHSDFTNRVIQLRDKTWSAIPPL